MNNLLTPKGRYKKEFKGDVKTLATTGTLPAFGSYALKCMNHLRLKASRIEAARKTISRYVKKSGRFWIRVFPHVPVTGKPAEVRMGRGKGDVDYHAARVSVGQILFEIEGVSKQVAIEAFTQASDKLGASCVIVENLEGGIYESNS